MKKIINFLYKLFFTRNDDLDVLQILFSSIVIISLMVVWVIVNATEESVVKIEALITLRWLAGLLVLTAVPKWLVPAMKSIVSKKEIRMNTQPVEETHAETN